jgi:hypothetical protein
VVGECDKFDAANAAQLLAVGGNEYSLLTQLVYRQVLGAQALVWIPSKQTAYYFQKEISSCGCLHTQDVIYPAFPLVHFPHADTYVLLSHMNISIYINLSIGAVLLPRAAQTHVAASPRVRLQQHQPTIPSALGPAPPRLLAHRRPALQPTREHATGADQLGSAGDHGGGPADRRGRGMARALLAGSESVVRLPQDFAALPAGAPLFFSESRIYYYFRSMYLSLVVVKF